MRKPQGFTILELITCLVILAIVSSVAMMKFLDIQGSAKENKIRDVAGNLRTGIDMIYAKSLIANVENECNYIEKTEIEGFFVCHGYPIAYIVSVESLLNIEQDTLYVENKIVDGHRVAAISFYGDSYTFETHGDFCQVLYQPEKEPQIITFTSAC